MDLAKIFGGGGGGGLLDLAGGSGGGSLVNAFAAELGKVAGEVSKNIPLAEYLGPAGLEKALGIENGPAATLGGVLEDNTDKLPALLTIVGGAVGAAYGNPQAGAQIGGLAGGAAAAFIDTSSDAGGPLDLDGQES